MANFRNCFWNASKDQFTNLIWSDEFDYTGAIDPDKWTHEVREQWFNNEVQSTTSLLENSKVEDGKLKITAIKKANGDYTSARIRTYKKLDFTYGRIDVKAKMPSKTNGVWPAIWLLGSNYESIDWPACGEMDIQSMLIQIISTFNLLYINQMVMLVKEILMLPTTTPI